MPLRTLIVDDEPHAIEVIEKYLTNFPEVEISGRCHNAIRAAEIIRSAKIDLLFLDIKMPALMGTDFIKGLTNPPKVIFTTAYQEYALDGFDLGAVDYLLKPIPYSRFSKAMDRVREIFDPRFRPSAEKSPDLEVVVNKEQFLYLRIKRENTKVKTSDILWIESVKDYIKVVLKDRVLTTKYKISVVEKLLPSKDFIRIHRSFIVSLDNIESFHPNYVKIAGKELPIGRNYKQDCYKRFLQS
ncbi:LytR/AlgR family response regulator transcription factor [Desertivirga xinjiangensis]|uniref:LytR/AlgR family response regulator transcription factor n=1 Tax=Desertivirga xinjiangensis TaxID=539206 RepID=UPI00210EEAC2|nr:LytTR family DNA-binding domain-containing protein [Pedobacter xinjiangensis]